MHIGLVTINGWKYAVLFWEYLRTCDVILPTWCYTHFCHLPNKRCLLIICAQICCLYNQLHQLSGWLVSDSHAGVETRCCGRGPVWLHMVCSCEAGLMYSQILWKDIETANFSGANVHLVSPLADIPPALCQLRLPSKTRILCVALQCISVYQRDLVLWPARRKLTYAIIILMGILIYDSGNKWFWQRRSAK